MTAAGHAEQGISTLWRSEKIRGLIVQAALLAALTLIATTIYSNAVTNLENRGIATGFGFLDQPAGFDISQTLITYELTDTFGRVVVIGALNTLLVAALGIVAATFLGVALGILRLSPNWLVSRLSASYLEIVRNIPLLLQMLFWYGVTLSLPRVRESADLAGVAFINNRGFYLPKPIFEPGAGWVAIAFAAGCVIAFGLSRRARRQRDRTGERGALGWAYVVLMFGLPLIAALAAGFPWTWDLPTLRGLNFQGGLHIQPALVALWLALTAYTGAFIGEIVRAGIQAVSRGQTEAAAALGLKPAQIMRLIVLPQALRVIIPPVTSQYLNLTKNSSLAVAIGYPEITSLLMETTLSQTGQAIEAVAITMTFYLVVSLLISLFLNWYNKKLALVER